MNRMLPTVLAVALAAAASGCGGPADTASTESIPAGYTLVKLKVPNMV